MSSIIPNYEKLGIFYLGKEVDPDSMELTDDLFLYKSKNLTTHAAIIGMTGSGKTGLGIDIIEEATLDGIPSILIDPKGDMGNLLLAFPELEPKDFEPWVDPAEAEAKQMSVSQYAEKVAKTWETGLREWHQDKNRIRTFKKSADFAIYTPGSSAGIPLSVLSSFDAPEGDILEDPDSFSALINSTVSSLLALIGIEADPLQSREYMLLASILNRLWKKGKDVPLEELIGHVTSPPFDRIGVLPLKKFYPQKDRLKLAMLLNNVLASPGFELWTRGESLDIHRLLYTEEGTPRVSILSMAHLSDAQRMFFVTLFLNRYINWMRKQTGTSSLRTILYMDEIFGFFPATGNPPSKSPMLLLLKQARAYGAGIILATQNPVDLDYKGLSNIGSWFIGRLQTRQDKERVMDGLVSGAEMAMNTREIGALISNLPSRAFLFKSAKENDLSLFQTRWVLSYLRGPITKQEIKRLMAERRQSGKTDFEESLGVSESPFSSPDLEESAGENFPPVLSEKIKSLFLIDSPRDGKITFEPSLVASARVRYVRASLGIDVEEEASVKLPLYPEMDTIDFESAEPLEEDPEDICDRKPPQNCAFLPLPSFMLELNSLKPVEKAYANYLYRTRRKEIYRYRALKLTSEIGESAADFKVRASVVLRDLKEEMIEKLEDRIREKEARIQRRYQRALERLEKEKADVTTKTTDTVLSFGMTLLGAFLGKKRVTRSTASRASTGIRNAGRVLREKEDVRRAEEKIARIEEELANLNDLLESEIDKLEEKYSIDNYKMETIYVKPRRSDIYDVQSYLCWESR